MNQSIELDPITTIPSNGTQQINQPKREIKMGNPEMALQLLKTWMADDSGYDEAVWPQLEAALDRSQWWPEKEKQNGHAMQLAETYYNRGNTHATLDEYDRAIADYTQAISIEPKLVQAYNKRGLAYHELGRYEEALEDYTQAIHIVERM